MSDLLLEDLPVETDKGSVVWALRLAACFPGDSSELDFDLLERMVQAIRNEAAREVCLSYEKNLANVWQDNWRRP